MDTVRFIGTIIMVGEVITAGTTIGGIAHGATHGMTLGTTPGTVMHGIPRTITTTIIIITDLSIIQASPR